MLFDAIEFNPLIASGDVLYDLAFLLMDLVERGLTPTANIAVQPLSGRNAESLRSRCARRAAAVPVGACRDPLQGDRRAHRTRAARGQEQVRNAARQYFDFARRFVAPPPPRLIAVGGLSGTGKSLLARALAPEIAPAPGAVVLRSDVERKRLIGAATSRPNAAARRLHAGGHLRVYAGIVDKARRAVAAGHSAIVDAVFAAPQERTAVEQSAAVLGVPFRGLFLHRRSRDPAPAWAHAAAMPPTPMRQWSSGRKTTISAGSTGCASMPPARRNRRWSAPGSRFGRRTRNSRRNDLLKFCLGPKLGPC